MKTIWKYTLSSKSEQHVALPKGAIILTAQTQMNDLFVWAIVDPNETVIKERRIEIVGTGHAMDDRPRHYLGTGQMDGGSLVWHVFELL